MPLLYTAALAAQAGQGAKVLVDGYFGGGISMTAYGLDIACPEQASDLGRLPPWLDRTRSARQVAQMFRLLRSMPSCAARTRATQPDGASSARD